MSFNLNSVFILPAFFVYCIKMLHIWLIHLFCVGDFTSLFFILVLASFGGLQFISLEMCSSMFVLYSPNGIELDFFFLFLLGCFLFLFFVNKKENLQFLGMC